MSEEKIPFLYKMTFIMLFARKIPFLHVKCLPSPFTEDIIRLLQEKPNLLFRKKLYFCFSRRHMDWNKIQSSWTKPRSNMQMRDGWDTLGFLNHKEEVVSKGNQYKLQSDILFVNPTWDLRDATKALEA